MAPVAADIYESAELTVSRSGHDDRDVARDGGEKAPGLRELVRPPRVLPGRRKDSLALELEKHRIRVPGRGQCPTVLEGMFESGDAVDGCEMRDGGS
jgi:hypothetical protein